MARTGVSRECKLGRRKGKKMPVRIKSGGNQADVREQGKTPRWKARRNGRRELKKMTTECTIVYLITITSLSRQEEGDSPSAEEKEGEERSFRFLLFEDGIPSGKSFLNPTIRLEERGKKTENVHFLTKRGEKQDNVNSGGVSINGRGFHTAHSGKGNKLRYSYRL